MKTILGILLVICIFPGWVKADEDNKSETSSMQIEGGKLIGEKHEIEIYDYHSGTYQTVDVYRRPSKTLKKDPDTAAPKQPSESTPR
ncbi:MAG: hypothetical protein BVN35_15845 [Proteobacteria bacterium ST_bin11]|jgi:hypothetical protein|nr:MAG: hypothetical protein BVN35_15845 [Proteobacteria bacterium ST_bin11]